MLKNTLTCLALASMCAAASAQVTITDIGATPPTPGANDISLSFPNFQGNDGLNYYWDNATPPGQTFTTGSNAGGYTLTSLSFQTAGGGNNQTASQSFTLEIYSIPDGINATLVSSNTVTGQLSADGHWMQVNGLGVPLSPNSEYAYTWHGSSGYEQLANDNANPYAGGQICLIPAGGGAVVFGTTGGSDGTFNIGLALGTVAGGTVTATDIGAASPTPGPNDITQLLPGTVPSQNNDGLNYYWDNNNSGAGQTFTTGPNANGYLLNSLALKTVDGGNSDTGNSIGFALYIYSVSSVSNTTLLQTFTASGTLNTEGDWLQWSNLNQILLPNTQYAYIFGKTTGSSYELMQNYGGNHYAGGQICLISTAAGGPNTLIFGLTGNSDAGMDIGLSPASLSAPVVTQSPTSVSAFVGRTVQFSGSAQAVPTPVYQWERSTDSGATFSPVANGGQFSGATTATLTVSNITLAENNWDFEFLATNSLGSSTNSLPATLTVIAAPPLSGSYSTSVLALNPVAYWPLNETYADPFAGGELAYDASGNNFDGLYLLNAENGFPEYGIVGPQPGDGYPQFTVGQGALDIPVGAFPNSWVTTPALNLNTNTVTILMWVNPAVDEAPATGLLFNRNSGTVGGMCYSTTNTLGYTWNNNDSATYSYTSGPTIPTNIWSLVALVITPSNASFYVLNTNNGFTFTTFVHPHTNLAWNGAQSAITIGNDTATSTRIFQGVIDEPAVFNYALSLGQLQALAGLPVVSTNPATANFQFVRPGGGSTINFSWAADHKGWQLYTNSVGLASGTNWFPVTGSGSVTSQGITIDPTQTNAFFQLRYP
jgi:hypothetical protein